VRPVIPYVVAALLFGLGVYGVLRRRNAILLLMSVELMLNAVNLILVTATFPLPPGLRPAGDPAMAGPPHGGQVFALFVIVLAAAEVGVGLAIVLQLYRLRASVAVDEVRLDDHPTHTDPVGRDSAEVDAGVVAEARPGTPTGPSTRAGTP
jgi:NADH-quinone oxidoreductase subunit K